MKQRNNHSSIPINEDTHLPLTKWWVVETDKGIAVAGEDARFDVETRVEAETMAANLAEFTDEKLTVVRYERTEYTAYQAVRTVQKKEPW